MIALYLGLHIYTHHFSNICFVYLFSFVYICHASKIIAPTISLNTGKIVYDYYLNLDGKQQPQHQNNEYGKVNSSLRAHVDPTKGILLKWTDGIRSNSSSSGRSGSGGSCWVTECRIPLGTSAPGSPLAADVRVGRRWVV